MQKTSILLVVILILPISFFSSATVTLKIQNGFNEKGLLRHIGYSMSVDNQNGTNNFYYKCNVSLYNIFTHKYSNETYPHYSMIGFKTTDSILSLPFPTLPIKISISITTETKYQLSLTRTGFLFLHNFILFTSGKENITGMT